MFEFEIQELERKVDEYRTVIAVACVADRGNEYANLILESREWSSYLFLFLRYSQMEYASRIRHSFYVYILLCWWILLLV